MILINDNFSLKKLMNGWRAFHEEVIFSFFLIPLRMANHSNFDDGYKIADGKHLKKT